MISKELLSEVLGYKCNPQFTKVALARGELAYYANSDNTMTKAHFINIYELAHKCKEWAVKEGYTLIEHAFAVELYNEKLVLRCCKIIDKTTILFSPLRVFKACQWILDNKEAN